MNTTEIQEQLKTNQDIVTELLKKRTNLKKSLKESKKQKKIDNKIKQKYFKILCKRFDTKKHPDLAVRELIYEWADRVYKANCLENIDTEIQMELILYKRALNDVLETTNHDQQLAELIETFIVETDKVLEKCSEKNLALDITKLMGEVKLK